MSRARPDFNPTGILAALVDAEVTFVVIGGLAADAHGVGWATFDADVMIEASDRNVRVLVEALKGIDGVFHTAHNPPIVPDVERIVAATGPLLLRTRFGRLDLLKEAGGEHYESLVGDALRRNVCGVDVAIASLAALVRMKRAANRPKDRAVLPAMEAVLAQRIRS